MAYDRKTKWRRNLCPDLGVVSPENAAVFGLHHIEMALAFMSCIDPEPESGDDLDVDNLERSLRDNEKRRRFMLDAIEHRYAIESVTTTGFREAATAFVNAMIENDNRLSREDAEG